MEISLEGRTALITGGSQGLGLAMAKRFAGAGGKVAMVARGEEALQAAEDAIGENAAGFACDITDTKQLAKLIPAIESKFGPVDILINNAGSSKRGNFLEMTDADWQSDLDLKLFGAIRLARLVMPGMMERKWGRIINVLNTAAKAPPPTSAPTSVSRAAGMALMKVLAGEGAPHNILVNANPDELDFGHALDGCHRFCQFHRLSPALAMDLREYLYEKKENMRAASRERFLGGLSPRLAQISPRPPPRAR